MKKRIRPESRSKVFRFVELNRDRFEKILDTIKERGEPHIVCGDYRFDSIDELCGEYGPVPGKLKIVANDPYILIEFDKVKETILHCETKNDMGDAMFLKLSEVLRGSERVIPQFLSSPWLKILILLVILFSFSLGAIYSPWILILSALFLVVFTIGSLSLEEAVPQINLYKRDESPSFLSRYKDDIVKCSIAGIAGLGIGFLLHYFFAR